MIEGKMERESNRQIEAASAAMWTWRWSDMETKEPSPDAKLPSEQAIVSFVYLAANAASVWMQTSFWSLHWAEWVVCHNNVTT